MRPHTRGRYAALLAHAAIDRGRIDEALRSLGCRGDPYRPPDDYDAQAGWRRARGLALAANGDSIEAETLLREAVAIVEATEDINLLGATLLDLAHVVEEVGRRADAEMLIDRAAALFEAKGSGAGTARIERLRMGLGASDERPTERRATW